MEKLTAIIPTKNEEDNIREVLTSVSFADEILVVDSSSSDNTVKIAKEQKNVVVLNNVEHKYLAAKKNWAIPQAKHKWILLIDADERVKPKLREEILEILKTPPKDDTVAYWIYRTNHFMGKRVRYSGWQNDKVIRLFKRDYHRYEDKMVHEEIIANGKVGFLKEKLYHNTYTTLNKHIEKLNQYADWKVLYYNKKTGKLTAYHFLIRPFWGFFKHYFVQMGFRDGIVGLTISYLRAYSTWTLYVKIWLYRKGLK